MSCPGQLKTDFGVFRKPGSPPYLGKFPIVKQFFWSPSPNQEFLLLNRISDHLCTLLQITTKVKIQQSSSLCARLRNTLMIYDCVIFFKNMYGKTLEKIHKCFGCFICTRSKKALVNFRPCNSEPSRGINLRHIEEASTHLVDDKTDKI